MGLIVVVFAVATLAQPAVVLPAVALAVPVLWWRRTARKHGAEVPSRAGVASASGSEAFSVGPLAPMAPVVPGGAGEAAPTPTLRIYSDELGLPSELEAGRELMDVQPAKTPAPETAWARPLPPAAPAMVAPQSLLASQPAAQAVAVEVPRAPAFPRSWRELSLDNEGLPEFVPR
jgi:hypothetical protein